MKDTFEMWKLVRFFKEKLLDIVNWDYDKDRFKEMLGEKAVELDKKGTLFNLLSVSLQSRHPRAQRYHLASMFSLREIPNDDIVDKEKTRLEIAKAQIFINNCIDSGFIGLDEKDKNKIYLPLKGSKFASKYGLLKEWIVEDIGPLKTSLSLALVWLLREFIPYLWKILH